MPNSTPLLVRMGRKIRVADSGCWIWTGSKNANGYGHVHVNGRLEQAHRVTWALLNGYPPAGLELDHRCRNRACVNPLHLELVTHRENLLRGSGWSARNAAKTECPRGHPYNRIGSNGGRRCQECDRRIAADRYRRIKEQANG